ncbi:hypothetical protein JCM9957A_28750 [Kineosporia succinea]
MLPDELTPGAEPTPGRLLMGTVAGLATAVIGFLVPQTLLVAVFLGTADYTTGQAHARLFTLLSALVAGFACGSGAFVAARSLRRAGLSGADSLRAAPVPPAVLALGLAVAGRLSGGGWVGGVLLLAVALTAVAVGARRGATY